MSANPTIIETIARAIAEGLGDDFDLAHRDKPHWIETRGESGGRFRDINEPRKPDFLDAARSAITAIEQSGHAIVPIEPTEAMIDAGYNSEDCDGWSGPASCWQRMIEAGKVKQ